MSFTMNEEQLAAYTTCSTLERKFVINIVRHNMTQRVAYYAAGGKANSDTTADVTASRMYRNVRVRAFYHSLMHKEVGDAIMARDEALTILSNIGRTSVKDVVDFKEVILEGEDGPIRQTIFVGKDGNEISEESAKAISEVSVGSGGIKIKLHSVPGAIKQLADMEGWNAAKKTELTGQDGGAIEVATDKDLARRVAYMLAKAGK
jgi:phage terminase small subunit